MIEHLIHLKYIIFYTITKKLIINKFDTTIYIIKMYKHVFIAL